MTELISIGVNNHYYAISIYNLEEDETTSIVYPSFEAFKRGLKSVVEGDVKIVFDNEDSMLSRYLIGNYQSFLLTFSPKKETLNRRIYGIFPTKKIVEEYGYDYYATGALQESTMLSKYMVMKSMGL